jgi:hypothetical protein
MVNDNVNTRNIVGKIRDIENCLTWQKEKRFLRKGYVPASLHNRSVK